jgi:hypothetical protein
MVYSLTWPATNLLASQSNKIIEADAANSACPATLITFSSNSNTLARPSHVSPYACLPISYGAKSQLTPKSDTSTLLDDKCKHRIQEIVGSLLYYARAVDNKLLVALSAIAA